VESFYKKQAVGISFLGKKIELLGLGSQGGVDLYSSVELKEGIWGGDQIIDKGALVDAFRELLKKARPTRVNILGPYLHAVFCLPQEMVSVHLLKITGNHPTDESLFHAVQKEGARAVRQPLEELFWDYLPINEPHEGAGRFVLFAACPKELIIDFREILLQAHVRPVVIDIEFACVGRAVIPAKTSDSSLVVDIGASSSSFAIFNKDLEPIHVSTLKIGGDNFTKSIMSAMKVSEAKAQELKLGSHGVTEHVEKQIADAIEKPSNSLISEMQDIIARYEKDNNQKISHIYLAGEFSLVPGLEKVFASTLDRPIEIGKPFSKVTSEISFEEDEQFSQIRYASLVGAALRGLLMQEKGFNLSSAGEPKKTEIEKKGVVAAAFKTALSHPRLSPTVTARTAKEKIKLSTVLYALVGVALMASVLYFGYGRFFSAGSSRNNPNVTLQPPPPAQNPTVVIGETPTGWLRVRSGAGTEFEEVTRVNPGERYALIEETEGWYKIDLGNGSSGWISSEYAVKNESL